MTAEEITPALVSTGKGPVLSCHVQPNASVTKISGMHGTELKIALKSPPVDGKANGELCRFLSEKLDLPKRNVQLISGLTSRSKKVAVSELEPNEILRRLCL